MGVIIHFPLQNCNFIKRKKEKKEKGKKEN